MPSDYDEREGYEEDHEDRDNYPEGVWEQIQAERRREEGGGDDDDLDEFINPPGPEPKPPSFTDEQLKEMEEDYERMEREQGTPRAEPDTGDLPDPF
jgi:hypothetical protein